MKKIKLSKIAKNKKYELEINESKVFQLHEIETKNGSDIIRALKKYYNMGDMICDEQDFPGRSGVKDEKSFLEYLENRKSPGCDKIELFEV